MKHQSQFQKDLEKPLNVNNSTIPLGYWNLIISIRDMKLYMKGLRPSRFWRLKDVKGYFGLHGSPAAILDQLEAIKESIQAGTYEA